MERRAGALLPLLPTRLPPAGSIVLALGAGLVRPPVASAQAQDAPTNAVHAAPAKLHEVRARLLERVRRGESPSFAVGLVRGANVEWDEAIGWANREAKIGATPDTRYAVASVSKSLTATGAMALVGSGRMRLETSADPVLASGRRRGTWTGSATLTQLLDHTSGVPHTNLGYGVVAELMERAESAPFQRVMERVLFSPLDMRGTTVDAWVGKETSARGYERDGRAIPYQLRLAPDGGAGFFSTLDDLLRYCRFHLGFLERPEIPPDASS